MIKFSDVQISYGDYVAVDNLNLEINEGEFFTMLGPSGCGKTTTLRSLVGFSYPTKGKIFIGDVDVTKTPTEKRGVSIVFQSYALFPTMNVYENIAFGLTLQKLPKEYIDKRVREAAEKVQIVPEKLFNNVSELSGGQQQRVAIARALVLNPKILCLDEPLSNLDAKLRVELRNELKKLQNELKITTIYVTHDQEEALSMSDTVVVMDKGKIQQIGTPEDIYNEPVNAFVADFIGESNIVDAIMIKDYLVSFGGVTFECLDSGFGENAFVEAVVRPEDIKIVKKGSKASLPGKITSVTFKGVHFEILVDVGGFIWMIQTIEHHKVGEEIGMYIEPDAIHIMNRSEYSGEFGDYSYFSDEMDHISDASYNWEEENEEE